MGNTLTLAYNKIQYQISKVLTDPDADDYAKQQAAQAEQDKAVADRDAAIKAATKEAAEGQTAQQKEAAELEARSKFSSPSEFAHKVSKSILNTSIILIIKNEH